MGAEELYAIGLDSALRKSLKSARKQGTRETIVNFNRTIIDATRDLPALQAQPCVLSQPHGDEGWKALRETIQYIRDAAPEIPVILDASAETREHKYGVCGIRVRPFARRRYNTSIPILGRCPALRTSVYRYCVTTYTYPGVRVR